MEIKDKNRWDLLSAFEELSNSQTWNYSEIYASFYVTWSDTIIYLRHVFVKNNTSSTWRRTVKWKQSLEWSQGSSFTRCASLCTRFLHRMHKFIAEANSISWILKSLFKANIGKKNFSITRGRKSWINLMRFNSYVGSFYERRLLRFNKNISEQLFMFKIGLTSWLRESSRILP